MVVVTNGGSDKANTLAVMPRITRMRYWATQAC
jgi:pyridoxine/pyridoxamine 5'-phosphate oxidase